MRFLRRPAALLVAAAALLLSAQSAFAAGPQTPPEKQTGSVGPYVIADGPLQTAAICRYADAEPLALRRIIVKPPKVRWPDTNASNPNQHGRVRHRIIVQVSIDQGQTWKVLKTSTTQTATAGEQVAAALTKRTVSVSLPDGDAIARVVSRIDWVRPDGSVRGTLRHWYAWVRAVSDQLQGSIGPSPCVSLID